LDGVVSGQNDVGLFSLGFLLADNHGVGDQTNEAIDVHSQVDFHDISFLQFRVFGFERGIVSADVVHR
jgi:hypothetical protein